MKNAKAMLDSLMGPSRNIASKHKTGEDFKEENVCKFFLIGKCPFATMKKYCDFVEPCQKLHSVALKEELEKHSDKDKYWREYEAMLIKEYEKIVQEADARGLIQKRKCRPAESVCTLPVSLKEKIEMYEESRKLKYREADELGQKGDIQGSQAALRCAELDQAQIDDIKMHHMKEFPGESVCTQCGVKYLNGAITDRQGFVASLKDEIWENDHFESKGHKAFGDLRTKLTELREKQRNDLEADRLKEEEAKAKGEDKPQSGDRDRRGGDRRDSGRRDGSRGRDRKRSRSRRSRSRRGDRDRGDRSRSRDRRRRRD